MKHGKKPKLKMLQPSASRPPSAKNRDCTISTEAIARNPAYGPRRIASIMPPPICPLDPVAGMVKLIICAAKMNAPRTPIRGIICSSICFFSLEAQYVIRPPLTAIIAIPTVGDTSASAICII